LSNSCAQYAVLPGHLDDYEAERDQWVADGWLELHDPQVHGDVFGLIPLMAANQPNKPKKVHPVMDCSELNSHVESRPGQDTAACQQKLREWRKQSTAVSLLELKMRFFKFMRAGICYVPVRKVQRSTLCDDQNGIRAEYFLKDNVGNHQRSVVTGC